jgi:hypothetical protein
MLTLQVKLLTFDLPSIPNELAFSTDHFLPIADCCASVLSMPVWKIAADTSISRIMFL